MSMSLQPLTKEIITMINAMNKCLARPRHSLLALLLFVLLWSSGMSFAVELSHQNPPKVAPGQMTTVEGKLDAAMAYADWFLAEDTRKDQAFFTRSPRFPTWKDQPILDCSMHAIVRAMQIQEPYFEDMSQKVVVVPVMVELLVLNITGLSSGPAERSLRQDDAGCTFEYERYNFTTQRFEKRPGFRKHALAREFRDWGGYLEGHPNNDFRHFVVPDLDKRYVRFRFRISVARDAPYQLEPQFPRHFLAHVALPKLQWSINFQKEALAKGVSLRNPTAIGDELQKDLLSTEKHIFEDHWVTFRIQDSLLQLQNVRPFSEIKP